MSWHWTIDALSRSENFPIVFECFFDKLVYARCSCALWRLAEQSAHPEIEGEQRRASPPHNFSFFCRIDDLRESRDGHSWGGWSMWAGTVAICETNGGTGGSNTRSAGSRMKAGTGIR